jgi:tetratricopeptide (TPR) repeat protein
MAPRLSCRATKQTAAVVAWLACAAPASAAAPPASALSPPRASDAELSERAEAAEKAGDWKTAEAAYRELCRRTPAAAKPHRGLGTVLLSLERSDEALAELQRSVAIEDSAVARHSIGMAYGQKEEFGKAAESFRLAVTLKPDFPLAWSYLVDALARTDRQSEALDTVTEARAKCAPCVAGSAFARNLRPLVLYHQGKAARLFDQGKLDLAESGEMVVLTLDPDFADAYHNLGKIAAARGKLDAAEAMYRKALAYYRPEESRLAADAKNNLAILLAGRRAGREAVSLVQEAIALRGERPSYLDTLGRACEAVNDRPCAREAYRKLLQSAGTEVPADVTAHAKQRLAKLEAAAP